MSFAAPLAAGKDIIRQKWWTNVRIFGSVESPRMFHVGIPFRMIEFETTPARTPLTS